MDQPCINLMIENLVAHKEDPCEHVLDHRVATDTSLVDRVEKFTSTEASLHNISIQLSQCWKQLLVES